MFHPSRFTLQLGTEFKNAESLFTSQHFQLDRALALQMPHLFTDTILYRFSIYRCRFTAASDDTALDTCFVVTLT